MMVMMLHNKFVAAVGLESGGMPVEICAEAVAAKREKEKTARATRRSFRKIEFFVIPAKAGIHAFRIFSKIYSMEAWIPASAGMTEKFILPKCS